MPVIRATTIAKKMHLFYVYPLSYFSIYCSLLEQLLKASSLFTDDKA